MNSKQEYVMRYRNLCIFVVFLLVIGLAVSGIATQPNKRMDYGAVTAKPVVEVSSSRGQSFVVNVSDSREERLKGLSGLKSLHNDGMLFAYRKSSNKSYWMKDVHIPLQIIFLNADGKVINIEYASVENVTGDQYYSIYRSEEPAKYVLELPQTSFSNGTRYDRFSLKN